MRLLACVVALAPMVLLHACGTSAAPDTHAEAGAPRQDAALTDTATAPDAQSVDAAEAAAPLHVLFIGNSYTYVNDLPDTVGALCAATPGAACDVAWAVQGSAALQDHWNNPATVARIAMGGWNAVVLQGQSVEPLYSPTGFHQYAGLLAGAVREAGASPVWYATWARRPGDPIFGPPDAGLTPSTMTQRLEDGYRQAATDFGGTVARVGAAWQLALTEQPSVELYAGDGSHPSPAGTLLTACVLLQTLSGRTPQLPDPPPLGVAPETARALCALAPRVR